MRELLMIWGCLRPETDMSVCCHTILIRKAGVLKDVKSFYDYSTVTLLARLRGLSTSVPLATAT